MPRTFDCHALVIETAQSHRQPGQVKQRDAISGSFRTTKRPIPVARRGRNL
jgi:hypothetical protein